MKRSEALHKHLAHSCQRRAPRLSPLTLALLGLIALPAQAEVSIQPLPPRTEMSTTLPSRTEVLPPTASTPQTSTVPVKIEETASPAVPVAPKGTPTPAVPPPPTGQASPRPKIEAATPPEHSAQAKNRQITTTKAPKATTPPAPTAATSAPADDPTKRYNDTIAQPAIVAFDAKRYEDAAHILKQGWPQILEYQDFGMMSLLGYAAMHNNDAETSLMAFGKAAELTEDDQFYLPLADALLHFGRLDEAKAVLDKMSPSPERDERRLTLTLKQAQKAFDTGLYPQAEMILLEQRAQLPAGGLELLGWIQYRLGKLEAAAEQFEQSYRKSPSQGAAQGLVFSLHRLKRHAHLLAIAQAQPGPLDALLPPAVREAIARGASQFSVDSQAQLSLASGSAPSNDASPGVRLSIAPSIRHKKGTPGEGKLEQANIPIQLTWQGAQDEVQLTLTAQKNDDEREAIRGNGLYALWKHHSEEGLEYRLGLGRGPEGGLLDPAILGEAGLGYYQDDWGLGGRLFRRGNEESLLALQGKPHPTIPGAAWGRVIETGLSLDGYKRFGPWQSLASVTASRLTGEGVADNHKLEVYARALHPLQAIPGLALGPELYASHFDKNLSAFEPGHGGYFSPDRFIKLGALASYETRIERLDLKFLAGVGYGWSRQEAAPGNPLTGTEPGKYPASSNEGIAYHGLLTGSWALDPHWRLGFNLGGQKSPDYTDWRAGFSAERSWTP